MQLLPNNKILDLSNLKKAFASGKITMTQKFKFVLGNVDY